MYRTNVEARPSDAFAVGAYILKRVGHLMHPNYTFRTVYNRRLLNQRRAERKRSRSDDASTHQVASTHAGSGRLPPGAGCWNRTKAASRRNRLKRSLAQENGKPARFCLLADVVACGCQGGCGRGGGWRLTQSGGGREEELGAAGRKLAERRYYGTRGRRMRRSQDAPGKDARSTVGRGPLARRHGALEK